MAVSLRVVSVKALYWTGMCKLFDGESLFIPGVWIGGYVSSRGKKKEKKMILNCP